ncbi:MAG: hypothetical protein H6564_14310 [Lewinellaceae bacterium]|nr:hypothetical protein [Lewinellaceae bacterium]
MYKSTLAEAFRSLSKRDIRELRKFVRSPYFNQRDDVIRLFDYLVEAADQGEEALRRERAYAYVFPGQAYDDAWMKLVMHFLLNAIRQYFAMLEVQADDAGLQLHLVRALRRRGLDRLFEKEMKNLEQQQVRQPYRNVGYHYHNYQLQLERYEYDHRQRRSGRMNLQELAEELTIFYLADILRHSCTVLTARNISQEDYQLELLEEVLRYVERSPVRQSPAVAIYHQAYKALSEPDQEFYFDNLLELIEKHWQQFPPDEARDIYLLAINYCIQRLNKGQRLYIQQAFELYRKGLERGVLLEEGALSKFTYNNVLMLAIALQEWEWAEGFLEQYKAHLPERERENIYRYNLAVYYFRKPDYGRAMELLQQASLEDVLYSLNARSMLLRIYYELEEFDALESLLDSFRTFISRQKGLGYHKEHYLNLLSFVRQMLRLPPGDYKARQKLRRKVEGAAAVAEKGWLLEKL